jgi:hypothetical protein
VIEDQSGTLQQSLVEEKVVVKTLDTDMKAKDETIK